jgi:hypothetical protein
MCRIEASLGPLFEKNPAYKATFEAAKIPERIIQVSAARSPYFVSIFRIV